MNESEIVNLSDPISKRTLIQRIGAMTGPYEVLLKKWRSKRSNQANRYFHGVIVKAYRAYEAEQGNVYSHDQAFEMLKVILMPVDFVNRKTGQVQQIGGSSSNLDVGEFSNLCELALALFGQLNIVVPSMEEMCGT